MEPWFGDALLRIAASVPVGDFDHVSLGELYDLVLKAGPSGGRAFDWSRRAWVEPGLG